MAPSAGLPTIVAVVVMLSLGTVQGAIDGLARTPPMGWRNWNFFQGNITQDIMIRNMEVRMQYLRLVHSHLFVSVDFQFENSGCIISVSHVVLGCTQKKSYWSQWKCITYRSGKHHNVFVPLMDVDKDYHTIVTQHVNFVAPLAREIWG